MIQKSDKKDKETSMDVGMTSNTQKCERYIRSFMISSAKGLTLPLNYQQIDVSQPSFIIEFNHISSKI